MPPRPRIVLADDLTGAAEIAAIAHSAGLRAVVLTRPPSAPVDADVLVLDTDTRLAKPTAAARRVRAWTARLVRTNARHRGVFIKVDSVLRGPVLAQTLAAARALGLSRVILAPANPSLGRTIRKGRYFIHGRFLHETAFSKDPHHPRNRSEVLALLGRAPRGGVVSLPADSAELPDQGVILGEASNSAEIRRWRGRLSADTLPAGGADFFRAWLGARGPARTAAPRPRFAGPALLLHGTTASASAAGALVFRGVRAPALAAVADRLARHNAAVVAAPARRLADPTSSAALSTAFAKIAVELHRKEAWQHLFIAGGATAAAVLSALGWDTMKVVHVWAPGVVTLSPLAQPEFFVTLKPGSYPWPDALRRALPKPLFS